MYNSVFKMMGGGSMLEGNWGNGRRFDVTDILRSSASGATFGVLHILFLLFEETSVARARRGQSFCS